MRGRSLREASLEGKRGRGARGRGRRERVVVEPGWDQDVGWSP